MTTKVSVNKDEKGEFIKRQSIVNWQRFSCSGENCAATEKCARWDHIYQKTRSPRNN